MATGTAWYNLTKPAAIENFNLSTWNTNLDMIDEQMHQNETETFTGATELANGTVGNVPAPLMADKDKFLKGDGTWGTPSGGVDMTGATASSAGTHGLVPAPAAGDNEKFLRGDGTWQDASGGSSTLSGLTDTDITTPTNGQILKYDATSSKWINVTASGGGVVMTGATSSVNGTQGEAPQPLAGDQEKVLTGAGTWTSLDNIGTSQTYLGNLIPRVTSSDNHITASSEGTYSSTIWSAWGALTTDISIQNVPESNSAWVNANGDSAPWIMYHFDEPRYFTEVEIKAFSNYGSDFSGTIYIEASNDASTWTDIGGGAKTINAALSTLTTNTYSISNNNYWRYIRIRGIQSFFELSYPACFFQSLQVKGGKAGGGIVQYIDFSSLSSQQVEDLQNKIGDGSSGQSTVLLDTPITDTGTYTLADDYTNYDIISILAGNGTTETDIHTYTVDDITSAMSDGLIITTPNTAGWFNFTMNAAEVTIPGMQVNTIYKIVGYKFGGGTTTTVTVTPKVLTGTNIADITVGNGNTTDIYNYAYFNGNGYYETPFKVDTDHEYEIIFEADYDATMAVIGTYAGANYLHLTIYNNRWFVGTNNGEVNPSAYTTGKHTFKTDSSHTYLDDTQFTSYTPALVNNYITIGARQNTYLYKGKFYEFKIKSISTGNVLYDLVPGMRGTTKGLYDLVSDTFVECSFISNMGTKTGTSGDVTTQLYAPSIEANPSGTATDSLSSIEINGTIYNIESGGGSHRTYLGQLIPRVSASDSKITASTSNSSYAAWGAFNGTSPSNLSSPNANSCWLPEANLTDQWIKYHFDAPRYFTKIGIVCFSNYSSNWVGDIKVEGSTDGSTWTNILASGTTYELTAELQTSTTVEINLDDTDLWEYIRVTFVDEMSVAYQPSCFIDEIYVYGGVETTILNYSTLEQNTGLTWIDGKPIFQKTIYYAGEIGAVTVIDNTITSSDIDYFVCTELSYYCNGTYRGSGLQLEVYPWTTGINVSTSNAPNARFEGIYATIRYTKVSSS